MSTKQFIKSLHKLTPAELEQVKARATALLNGGDDADLTSDEELVLKRITIIIEDRGETCIDRSRVKHSPTYSTFRDGVQMLMNFVDQFIQPKDAVDREAACSVMLNAVVACMAPKRPVVFTTICQDMQKISSVIDDQFPGYRESHLLPMLLRQE